MQMILKTSLVRPSRLASTRIGFGLLALAMLATGCDSKKEGKNEVSGKVTLDGKPVSGNVIFISGDGKETQTLIASEGKYAIELPPGEYKVAVRGGMGGMAGKGAPKGAAEMPAMPGAGGTAPPAKYATAAGGLTFSHPGGKKTYDIQLTP